MTEIILFILLIILIIVAVLLLISISKDYEVKPVTDLIESSELKTGGDVKPVVTPSRKKVIVVDGLNYIYDKFLTKNKKPVVDEEEDGLISNYPNIFYVWKALSTLRSEHKNDHIVFVIKNHDSYKISVYEDKLYKKWAKSYKMGIIMCYDSSHLTGPHYVKGRDDKTVCEIYNKYKSMNAEVELISKDKYNDKADFGGIPPFKKIKYGVVPYITD